MSWLVRQVLVRIPELHLQEAERKGEVLRPVYVEPNTWGYFLPSSRGAAGRWSFLGRCFSAYRPRGTTTNASLCARTLCKHLCDVMPKFSPKVGIFQAESDVCLRCAAPKRVQTRKKILCRYRNSSTSHRSRTAPAAISRAPHASGSRLAVPPNTFLLKVWKLQAH